MARIRGYMGVSVDGYIASPGGGIDWLRKYDGVDFGDRAYDRFIADIATVVMGRTTYDEIAGYGLGWLYPGKRAFIVTSRPLDDPMGPLTVWDRDIDALVAELRGLDDGDVWIVGGGKLQQAFIARGALDRLELFVVPEIVGGGHPTFPPNGFARSIRLIGAQTFGSGVVHLDYAFD
ncbi:dihydrofolate reductase family protein [Kaistia dalseonensis]|uniref:Dihydrofolate reductase n=1 Tax=Kaistia dalseonensis TaxID=410840 RepID=A0ABU0H6C9_9HYPH|nr:dihydrofolate reductase family protein [Kaistia dalseonensis]MCX5495265.1 dihydrofolate reductase family protein [Kaistia dalseonensis]MDQ0437851.1 dihydrofolate reductase [Kaistia dalseonensis]